MREAGRNSISPLPGNLPSPHGPIRCASGRPVYFYLAAATVLALDQVAKLAATALLKPRGSIPLLGEYLSLSYRTNTGAAFGLAPWAPTLLAVFGAVVVVALLFYGWRLARGSRLLGAALACLLGGAAGNLLDRVRLGYVVDFIDLHFWPVFNLADAAITVGAILFVCGLLISEVRGRAPDSGPHAPD